MRSLPFKKYQTCELKSKIIDYRAYSVKICAFYLASATTFFFLNFEKNMGQLKFDLFLRESDVLLTPNNHWFFNVTFQNL